MDELPLPAARAEQLRLDHFEQCGEDGLRELVRHGADRVLPRPPVEFLGTAIPVGNDVAHVAHEHGVVRQIEEVSLLPQRLFSPLTFRDVDHHPAQFSRPVALDHDGHKLPQPDASPVSGEHAVFKIVAPFVGGGLHAEINGPLAVVRMEMVFPEGRLVQPALGRVPEDALGLLTDEREHERLGVRFPHDPLDRIDQVGEPLLRSYGLGVSRLLTHQQLLALRMRPLTLGNLAP